MNIFDGRKAFYQWDTNRKIRLNAPCQELHIGRGGDETTIDVKVLDSGGDYYAEVPDEILQDAAPFIAYGYVTTPDGNYTRVQQRFAVIAREKPAGYIYTPAERLTWAQIQAQIGDLSNLTTEDKTSLVAAINEAAKSGGGGGSGKDGTGIASITYKGEDEDGGNVYTVLLTDGTSYEITAPKGAKGDKGDTGATGPQGPAGAPGKDGAGMDITGATVGQTAKIAAVDASGVPTAWSPVDMPSGGGGETWKKIAEIELRTDTAMYVLANFGIWRKAKVIMHRSAFISGLQKNVWCSITRPDRVDYNCGYLTLAYGYIYWEFTAEVNELFITSTALENNNTNVANNLRSSYTLTPLDALPSDCNFVLRFVDTSVIQEGDKVTVIGVRR